MPKTLRVRLMMAAGCCAILGTSPYEPPRIAATRQHELSEKDATVVTVSLNVPAREQAGRWIINISARMDAGGELKIAAEAGPHGLEKEVRIGMSALGSSVAGSSAHPLDAATFRAQDDADVAPDDDAGSAGVGAWTQQQFVQHQLLPDVADCPDEGQCEVKFSIARAAGQTGVVSLTVQSWAHRPMESGCMGDTAPEFTPGAKLQVGFDE